jgi:hypothetical protein
MEDHYHSLELDITQNKDSLNLERIILDTKIAEQEFNVQKGVTWEGVSIGPMFMEDVTDEFSDKLYGFQLTMPIPLWQVNGAARAMSNVRWQNLKSQFNFIKDKEQKEKASLKERISELNILLTKLPSRESLFKSHKRIQAIYGQGLVSPASFLEANRVWRDQTATRLELEEKILVLQIEYYRLNGQLNEVHI